MKVSNEDIDDSLFLKRIIDGSFFEAKKSEEQDYILDLWVKMGVFQREKHPFAFL